MSSNGKGRYLSWALAIPLAAFLLYWSLRGVDWKAVGATLAGANWTILGAATLFTCFSFLIRALRWRILLNAAEKLTVGEVFCATMAGYLGNSFLPARAGELVRTLVVSGRSSLTKTYVLTTALSERLLDAVALVLWSSIILIGVHPKPDWMGGVARTMAVVAGAGAVTIAILPHTGNLAERVLKSLPLPHALRLRLIELMQQILLGMRAFHHTTRFLGFAALTIVIWVSDATGTMVAARALGLVISFPLAMLFITALGLSSALPSTPGYVGVFQFVAITVLTPFGITKSQALAFILMTQAYGYVVVLALGLPCMYVLKSRRKVTVE